MKVYTLKSGDVVLARLDGHAKTYANRTQANKQAAAISGAEVIQRGRPFYVRIPAPSSPVSSYLAAHGNLCPIDGCGGSVDGIGEQEWREDEIAVGRKCLGCGATWDDFYTLSDISVVTPKEKTA